MARKRKQINKKQALALIQSPALKGLNTEKQKLFCIHFASTLNRTQAAKDAGYGGDYATLRAIGSENLTKPHIQEAVAALLAERVMGEAEALARLSQHARADLGEFLDIDGDGQVSINVQQAKDRGVTHLIKKFKTRTTRRSGEDFDETTQTVELELHDQQAALDKVLKVHGSYKERDEPPAEGGTTNIFFMINQGLQNNQS